MDVSGEASPPPSVGQKDGHWTVTSSSSELALLPLLPDGRRDRSLIFMLELCYLTFIATESLLPHSQDRINRIESSNRICSNFVLSSASLVHWHINIMKYVDDDDCPRNRPARMNESMNHSTQFNFESVKPSKHKGASHRPQSQQSNNKTTRQQDNLEVLKTTSRRTDERNNSTCLDATRYVYLTSHFAMPACCSAQGDSLCYY